jgi:nitrate reductase gamma subunit
MPVELIIVGCLIFAIISFSSFVSIQVENTGPIGFFFGCLFAGLVVLGIYRIVRQNAKRVTTVVDTVSVVVIDDCAFIKNGPNMVNMNALLDCNIAEGTKIDITEWTDQVGWIYFGKDRGYKIHDYRQEPKK